MRFGPQYTNLPLTVPQELYSGVKVKKDKPKILDSPNVEQKHLIRSIAKQLPERIWHDPMVFPQREGVLLALAQLSELDVFVGGWLTTNYTCIPTDGGRLALYNKNNQKLVEGDSGEMLHYARQFARKAIPAIVHVHRLGFVVHPNLSGVLHEDLNLFRRARECSKGLDRISKIEELSMIDQDNTINKFQLEPGMPRNPTCYHLGAGTNLSSSQRALIGYYEQVSLVDPRVKEGENSMACTWQDIIHDIPTNVDIISDVAFGDEQGMVLDGYFELVSALYEHSKSGALVMVKLPLQLGYEARGVLHQKPRPHNDEVIVILGEDGDPLDDLYEEWYPKIILTNKQRNTYLMKMAFEAKVKPNYNTTDEIKLLMLQKPPKLPPPRRTVKTPKKSRNRNLGVANALSASSGKRHTDWYRRLKDRSYPWDAPTVMLPTSFYVPPGPMFQYDPGLPDVDVALCSVRRAVVMNGYDLAFKNGSWNVV